MFRASTQEIIQSQQLIGYSGKKTYGSTYSPEMCKPIFVWIWTHPLQPMWYNSLEKFLSEIPGVSEKTSAKYIQQYNEDEAFGVYEQYEVVDGKCTCTDKCEVDYVDGKTYHLKRADNKRYYSTEFKLWQDSLKNQKSVYLLFSISALVQCLVFSSAKHFSNAIAIVRHET